MIIVGVIAVGAALINTFKEQGIAGILFHTIVFVVKMFTVVGLSVGIRWAWEE